MFKNSGELRAARRLELPPAHFHSIISLDASLACIQYMYMFVMESTMDDHLSSQEILDRINGYMHGPLSGFVKKYFGGFKFRYVHQSSDSVLKIHQDAKGLLGRYQVPSTTPLSLSPDDFLQWFSTHASWSSSSSSEESLGGRWGARGSWDAHADENGHENNGVRLLLTIPPTSSSPTFIPPASSFNGQKIRWDHVQVVGRFFYCNGSSSSVDYQHGLLCLYRSASKVFSSQPTRRFLHGFYIRGSLVEFWVFDRSGLYCSEVLDMDRQRDSTQVFGGILNYRWMTDQELGKSDAIKTDEGGNNYINLERVDDVGMVMGVSESVFPLERLEKLYLESEPMFSGEHIVGTATTCYQAKKPDSDQWDHVFKLQWRLNQSLRAGDRPEEEIMKLAREMGVWGAVSLDYFKVVESTADLRAGLKWANLRPRRFPATRGETTKSGNLGQGQKVVACETTASFYGGGGLAEHTEEKIDDSLGFRNRTLVYSVTSPLGRPLGSFQSLLELLQVFRDAIKCHRSLCCDAGILHQDVSPGNIIIIDPPKGEAKGKKPRGILIDYDVAVVLDQEGLGPKGSVSGTRPFMAIGVLQSERHTYRHDLESFLYVFLWTIITNHEGSPPPESKLQAWSRGTWDDAALPQRKLFDMSLDGFQSILGEFNAKYHSLKPLAEKLREILFPLRDDGAIWTATDLSHDGTDKLYDGIIGAFEDAIVSESLR